MIFCLTSPLDGKIIPKNVHTSIRSPAARRRRRKQAPNEKDEFGQTRLPTHKSSGKSQGRRADRGILDRNVSHKIFTMDDSFKDAEALHNHSQFDLSTRLPQSLSVKTDELKKTRTPTVSVKKVTRLNSPQLNDMGTASVNEDVAVASTSAGPRSVGTSRRIGKNLAESETHPKVAEPIIPNTASGQRPKTNQVHVRKISRNTTAANQRSRRSSVCSYSVINLDRSSFDTKLMADSSKTTNSNVAVTKLPRGRSTTIS